MDEQRIVGLASKCPWMEEYMRYTLHSEPPAEFHLLVGLTVLSTALGRRFFFRHGVFNVHPNIYSLLVAPSGKCRKSTAIKIGMDILNKASLDEVKIVGPKVTPEALIQAMYRERPVLQGGNVVKIYPDSVTMVYAPELAVFLNTRDFNKDTVPLLTDLYDSPDKWTTSTISRGEVSLHNVFVSCLSASTMHWLVELVPRSAFGGGFMGRLLLAAKDDTPRIYPVPKTPPPELQAFLIKRLQELGTQRAEVTWDQTAYDWFDSWYRQGKENRHLHEDDRLAGYLERKPITLIKLAIIRTAASGRTISTREDLLWANEILEVLEVDMLKVYAAVGAFETRTIDLQLMERLQGFLRVRGYVDLREIMRHMLEVGLTAGRTRELLYSLKDAGIVDVRRSDDTVIYHFIPEGKRATYRSLANQGGKKS